MKIFEITLGTNSNLIVAADEQDAFERRTEVDHAYDYLPVEVKELKIDGYDIRVEKEKVKQEDKQEVSVNDTPNVPVEEPQSNEPEKETPKPPKPKASGKAKNKSNK